MAEGDTILRTARRIESALGRQVIRARPGNARGLRIGIERLDGKVLGEVESRGKHLLLHLDDLVLHSHLGMAGSWQVYRRGERWRKPATTAWAVLWGEETEAVQFGGPILRVLTPAQLRHDPQLARLGVDVLAADFDADRALGALRAAAACELGDALLDQRSVAGIGNIFKSEACFAAGVSPWQPIAELGDEALRDVIGAARSLMRESAAGGRPHLAVYRRAGRPCAVCGTPIAARGQGDANRRTYWCPRCQPLAAAENG